MEPTLAEEDRPPATLTLEEYLHSSWSPDCDFVDGRSEERNVGTFPHASAVASLLWTLSGKQEWKTSSVLSLPSLRVRVSPTRIRVPDVCVTERGSRKEPILTCPPIAVIELLDDEDRFCAAIQKFADFERFGVKCLWAIDPVRKRAYRCKNWSLENVVTGELAAPGTPIRIMLDEMFSELSR
jgi:hypothetical protein